MGPGRRRGDPYSHNPQKHIAADTICTYAKSLSDSATSKLLTRLFRETSQAMDMGGWFSKTEVIIINNGTSCVEYHVENLVVGGVILMMCLACDSQVLPHVMKQQHQEILQQTPGADPKPFIYPNF